MAHPIEMTLDEQGQIVIPRKMADRLGLSAGMHLVAEEGDEGGLRLRVEAEATCLIDKGGILVARAEPLADLPHTTRQERDGRVAELVARTGL